MAVFDSNLFLRNTTQTVSSLIGGAAGYTGSWLTLGTGGGPVSFRASIQTSAGSNTDSMNLIYEFSDDQSAIKETVTVAVSGTEAGSGTSSGALQAPAGDRYTRTHFNRAYVRLRVTTGGTLNNFGVVTVGVDGGDVQPSRR